jgi:hypothetical protein
MWAKSNTAMEAPSRATPNTENAEPMRAKFLIDSELPTSVMSITERAEPSSTKLRTDTDAPK